MHFFSVPLLGRGFFLCIVPFLFKFTPASASTSPRNSRLGQRPRDGTDDDSNWNALALTPQQPNFGAFDLESDLPPAYSVLSTPVDLPSNCQQYVGPTSECTSEMSALNVIFEDCGSGFTICRCGDATMSMDTLVDRLGRVPVGLRRYAGTIMGFAQAANVTALGPSAYTLDTSGDTHFFGDCEMDTWIHEITHAFDFALPAWQSSAQGWAEALDADTCVPDVYSQTNAVEDFAQLSVILLPGFPLAVYQILHGGNLPPGFSADCMANQLAFLSSLIVYNAGTLFGNNCDIADGGPPGRHTDPPANLDPSRTFETIPAEDNPDPTPTTVNNSGSLDNGSRSALMIHAKGSWAGFGVVLFVACIEGGVL
ncbi:hypothetical protein C8F01DRAFT_1166736 [Mycena amicta]|nr:hypothetical protein C8F01DRAFT_1166736 [Mycena amicta]